MGRIKNEPPDIYAVAAELQAQMESTVLSANDAENNEAVSAPISQHLVHTADVLFHDRREFGRRLGTTSRRLPSFVNHVNCKFTARRAC